jgi:hypothetical protein
VTAQGHPRTILRRAIEYGNLILAQGMARELGQVTLAEALDLTVLVLQKEPGRRSGYTVGWLRRLLEERPQTTIEEAAFAASALASSGTSQSNPSTHQTSESVVPGAPLTPRKKPVKQPLISRAERSPVRIERTVLLRTFR